MKAQTFKEISSKNQSASLAEVEDKAGKVLMSSGRDLEEPPPYTDPNDALIQKRLKQLARAGTSLKRAVATAGVKKRKSKSPKKEYQGNLSRNMGIGFNEWHAYQTVAATRQSMS